MTAIRAWYRDLKRQPRFLGSLVRFWSLAGLTFALLALIFHVGATRGATPDQLRGSVLDSHIAEDLLLSVLSWGMAGLCVFLKSRKRDLLPASAWRIVHMRVGLGVLVAVGAVVCTGTVPTLVRAFAHRDFLVVFLMLGGMVLVVGCVLTCLTPLYYVRTSGYSEESDRGSSALPPVSSLQPPVGRVLRCRHGFGLSRGFGFPRIPGSGRNGWRRRRKKSAGG